MIETMTDLALGNTLTKINSNNSKNPEYNGPAVKSLFKQLSNRPYLKFDITKFKEDAVKFAVEIERYKTKNLEVGIEKDKFKYSSRNYTGRIGELIVQDLLGVPVSNNEFTESKNEAKPDLQFRGYNLGVKAGSIRKNHNDYSMYCMVPVISLLEKNPQIITLVNEDIDRAYIIGIMFPGSFKEHLKSNVVFLKSLVAKLKFGIASFSESVVVPFNDADNLEEVLKNYRK